MQLEAKPTCSGCEKKHIQDKFMWKGKFFIINKAVFIVALNHSDM